MARVEIIRFGADELPRKIPKGTLYRYINSLQQEGLLQQIRKGCYRTTEAGIKLLYGATAGLTEFCPLLEEAPTAQHRAVIELILAAITASSSLSTNTDSQTEKLSVV